MDTERFVYLVRRMREAQSKYFKTDKAQAQLKQYWLDEARRLEKQVDAMLEEMQTPSLF